MWLVTQFIYYYLATSLTIIIAATDPKFGYLKLGFIPLPSNEIKPICFPMLNDLRNNAIKPATMKGHLQIIYTYKNIKIFLFFFLGFIIMSVI